MTEKETKIGAGQLCAIAFLSRPIIMLTLNAAVLGGDAVLDNALSAVLILILGLLSAVPVFLLFARYPDLDILKLSRGIWGRAGIWVPVFYSAYFVLMGCYYVSFFETFIGNVMDPKTPVWLVGLGIIAVSCYGAKRGIEAIARSSGFIVVAILLGILVIFWTLLPEIRSENYRPLLYNGQKQLWNGAFLVLARGMAVPFLAFLLPQTKGKIKTAFVGWSLVTALIFGVLIVVLVGALGSFLNTQLFPVYTASALSKIGPIQRMDAIFLAIWMSGLVVELSAAFYLLSVCGKEISENHGGNWALFLAAPIVFAGALWAANTRSVQRVLFGKALLLTVSAIAAVGIPLLLWISDSIRKRGKGTAFKKVTVGMLAVLLVFLTGCEGQVLINRRMLIQGMGIDYRDGSYQVCVYAGILEEEEEKTVLYRGSGETLLHAMDEIVQYSGKTPMYSHNLFVLLGQSCGEAGLQNVIDFFVRYYESRASSYLFFCRTEAEDLFALQDADGKYPLAEETDILTDAEQVAGRSVNATVVDVVNGLNAPGQSAYLSVMEADDQKIRLNGTAYFRDGVYAGMLSEAESRGMLLLKNRFVYGAEAVPAEDTGPVTLSLRDASCRVKTEWIGDVPHFTITVHCEADISEITHGLGRPMGAVYYEKFEQALNETLQKEITAAIETAAVRDQCDVFGFSNRLLQQQPEIWRVHAESWPDLLQQLSYTVSVESNIARMEEEITPILH